MLAESDRFCNTKHNFFDITSKIDRSKNIILASKKMQREAIAQKIFQLPPNEKILLGYFFWRRSLKKNLVGGDRF